MRRAVPQTNDLLRGDRRLVVLRERVAIPSIRVKFPHRIEYEKQRNYERARAAQSRVRGQITGEGDIGATVRVRKIATYALDDRRGIAPPPRRVSGGGRVRGMRR